MWIPRCLRHLRLQGAAEAVGIGQIIMIVVAIVVTIYTGRVRLRSLVVTLQRGAAEHWAAWPLLPVPLQSARPPASRGFKQRYSSRTDAESAGRRKPLVGGNLAVIVVRDQSAHEVGEALSSALAGLIRYIGTLCDAYSQYASLSSWHALAALQCPSARRTRK